MKVKLTKIPATEYSPYGSRRLTGTCDKCFRENSHEWHDSNGTPHNHASKPWLGQCDCGAWFAYMICDDGGYYWSLPTAVAPKWTKAL